MTSTLEGKEGLQPAIQVLRKVAEQFNALENEAKIFSVEASKQAYASEADYSSAKENRAKCIEKLEERAQLLVDLPNRLIDTLENIDQKTKQQILDTVHSFATQAQGALESEEKYKFFALNILLTSKGEKKGDTNDLEKLIESL